MEDTAKTTERQADVGAHKISVLDCALANLRAGLSVFPILCDGSKAPPIKWGQYGPGVKDDDGNIVVPPRLATEREARQWWARRNPYGIAVAFGKVSGNAEVIDFDERCEEVFPQWCFLVESEAPGLLDRLTQIKTPRTEFGGRHVPYRCPEVEIPGNQKLAIDPTLPDNKNTMIETRGEGGYAIAPGSPTECHESGRPYLHVGGPPLHQIPTITAAEREILMRAARSFDLASGVEKNPNANGRHDEGLLPGTDYNLRGPDISKILEPHGWTCVKNFGQKQYWCRPGKTAGWSATWGCRNEKGEELFAVFSSNAAPLAGPANGKPCSCFTKFAVYTFLNHAGRFADAAKELRRQGYGASSAGAKQPGTRNGTSKPECNGQHQPNPDAADTPPTESSPPPPSEPPLSSWPVPIPLGTTPSVPEFSGDIFPGPIAKLVDEIAWAMNCPTDFAGVPILTMAGGAIGNARHVSITPTHTQPPLIFSGMVSPPGAVKSPPLMLLQSPFDLKQAYLIDRYKASLSAWDEGEDEARGPRPILKQCVVKNVTTERLGRLLAENPRGILMPQDELMSLVNGMNQYKGGRGNDRQFYLSVWSQETIMVNRQSDRDRDCIPLFVRKPFLAIHGNLQDDIVCQLRGESRRGARPPDDGWQDRFLLSYPRVLQDVGERWRSVSDEVLDAWKYTVETLLALEMVPAENGLRPFYVPLRRCAREAWEDFTNRHAAERNAIDFPGYLVGCWSKMKAYCARLALIVHLLRHVHHEVDGEDVDCESMVRAVRLVDYFKGHARKVHALLGADPRIADARKVLKWIVTNRLERFTKRDVHANHRATFPTADQIDPVLAILDRHFIIAPVAESDRTGPGRRGSPSYLVNPLVHEDDFHSQDSAQNTHNPQKRGPEGDSV